MNTIKSVIRIVILVCLFAIALYCIMSHPESNDMTRWVIALIVSKSFGLACLWIFLRLYLPWSKTDKWIARYHAWNMKGCNQ